MQPPPPSVGKICKEVFDRLPNWDPYISCMDVELECHLDWTGNGLPFVMLSNTAIRPNPWTTGCLRSLMSLYCMKILHLKSTLKRIEAWCLFSFRQWALIVVLCYPRQGGHFLPFGGVAMSIMYTESVGLGSAGITQFIVFLVYAA